MQLFGASIDVGDVAGRAADLFLHAGYISAYPRPYYLDHMALSQDAVPKLELDLVEAFRLQGEAVAQYVPSADSSGLVAALSSSSEWLLTVGGIAGFFGALFAAFIWRSRLGRWRHAVAALGVLALALAGVRCDEPLPDKEPWADVQLKSYANPELATQGLLHGIIADGLMNVGDSVTRLANIQNEVGLPVAELTAGQEYALQTYGLDGWGREFRLSESEDKYNDYEVRSAGADGVFDNADDLAIEVPRCTNESWDQYRWAFFVRQHENQLVMLFHRFNGGHFEYNNEELAQSATGGPLFDLFTQERIADLDEEILASLQASYAAYQTDHEPLVLQVYQESALRGLP